MAPLKVGPLGEFLREQRKSAQLSLRQLAEQAGVSNPYLSQIERGLRKPSAEILQQIAKGLRISAEQLYVQAGILDERPDSQQAFESALLSDASITERQKRMLLEIYRSFRAENLHSASDPGELDGLGDVDLDDPGDDGLGDEGLASDPGDHPDAVADPAAADAPAPAATSSRTAARSTRSTRRPKDD